MKKNLISKRNNTGKIESQILSNLPGPVVMIDDTMSITYVNEAAAAVAGRSVAQCMGCKCYEIFKTTDCNTPNCATLRSLKEDRPVTGRTIASPQNAQIPIQYSGIPIRDENGKVIGAAELITDLSDLYEVCGKVSQVTKQLTGASSQLAETANGTGGASQEVAQTNQEMARSAAQQATLLQQSSDSMQQFLDMVGQVTTGAETQNAELINAIKAVQDVSSLAEQVANSASFVMEHSKKSSELSEEGTTKTDMSIAGMQHVQASFNDVSKKVMGLGERSDEIGKIVSVIDDIAAQTNLLALNAAIEAARAGEHGRGFAVVSDEVRKLAERTVEATKEIADLISGVQSGVQDTVEAMESSEKRMEEGYALVAQVGQSLAQIKQSVADVTQQISEISYAGSDMLTSTGELLKMVETVGSVAQQNSATATQMSGIGQEVASSIQNAAAISEQHSAATEELSASAEEMGAQVQEVIASTETLNQIAGILSDSVAKLDLGDTSENFQEMLV